MYIDWNDEICAALGAYHVPGGPTYTRIAADLSERFGVVISRNAALGKAKRLGFVSPNAIGAHPRPSQEKKPRVRKKKVRSRQGDHHAIFRIIRANGNSNQFKVIQTTEFADLPLFRCVEIEPRHLSLPDLEPNDCRYPYGGDGENEAITFCGHPKWEFRVNGEKRTSSYCRLHFELTRKIPAPPRDRGYVGRAA